MLDGEAKIGQGQTLAFIIRFCQRDNDKAAVDL